MSQFLLNKQKISAGSAEAPKHRGRLTDKASQISHPDQIVSSGVAQKSSGLTLCRSQAFHRYERCHGQGVPQKTQALEAL
jgi:hypothetical protein